MVFSKDHPACHNIAIGIKMWPKVSVSLIKKKNNFVYTGKISCKVAAFERCIPLLLFMLTHTNTVRPVLSGQLKVDKTKVLMEKGNLMKVESIPRYVYPALSDNWY